MCGRCAVRERLAPAGPPVATPVHPQLGHHTHPRLLGPSPERRDRAVARVARLQCRPGLRPRHHFGPRSRALPPPPVTRAFGGFRAGCHGREFFGSLGRRGRLVRAGRLGRVPVRRIGVLDLLRRRGSGAFRRQEGHRIHVALGFRGDADAEMEVRLRVLCDAARPDRPHDAALGDGDAAGHAEGTEVNERNGVAVGSGDRDRPAAARDGASEGDHSPGGRANGRSCGRCEIHAAVMPGSVDVFPQRERFQNRPVHGPGPGMRGRSADQDREEGRDHDDASHGFLLCRCD